MDRMESIRVVLQHARALGADLVACLEERGARAAIAGGARRGDELVDELVLVADRAPSELQRDLVELLETDEVDVRPAGPPAVSGALRLGHGPLPVRVRSASPRGFVEALLRESGSDAHVDALEERAHARGTTLSSIALGARDEADVYAALGVPWIAPELRDGPELEVPSSLLDRVRGVFHVHTEWSDGVASIERMAVAARDAGHAYVGISDHSRAAWYARGLDEERLLAQAEAIARARRSVPGIEILHGLEVDVLEDGSLDLPDAALARLDFVVASLHSGHDLDAESQTRRMVRAASHPLVTVIGHPTNRLLLGKPKIAFDLDAVAVACARSGVALEINTSAQRLDLDVDDTRRAAALGASFCIDPDAHEPAGFAGVELGVLLARRARLDAARVLNARDTDEMVGWLRARRARATSALGIR